MQSSPISTVPGAESAVFDSLRAEIAACGVFIAEADWRLLSLPEQGAWLFSAINGLPEMLFEQASEALD